MLTFATSLAFYGLLRVSNLASPSARAFDPRKQLTIGSVRRATDGTGLTVTLLWTKSMQHRRSPAKIFIPASGAAEGTA